MNKILLIGLLLVNSSLFAKFPDENGYNNNNNNNYNKNGNNIGGFTGKYPYDKRKLSTPSVVQKERFNLNMDKDIVNKLQRDIERKDNLLDGTLDIAVLQKPIYKALKTVDTLYLHSNFITTIIFPKKLTIKTAGASFLTNEFSHSENILLLQPSSSARNGNIVLSLSNGKKNYMMTIGVKQYFREDNCKIEGGNYKCVNDYLATVIKYVQFKKLTTNFKLQLLEDYLRLNKLNKLRIKKNLGYVILQRGGETYYIIRDDEFGTIFKSGISLTIKNSIN